MRGIRSALGRIALTAVAGSCLGGLTATAAAGTTFCVNTVASQHCSGTLEPDLQTALTAAQTAPNDTQRNTVMFPATGSGSGTGVETGVGAIISDIQVVAQITDVRALEFHPPNSGYPSDSTVRRVKVAATPQPGDTTIGLFVEGTTVNADNIALRMSGGSGGTIGAEVVSDPSEAATLNLSHASVYGNADASPSPPTSVGVLDTT